MNQVGRALVFEAAGYSILGPTAIHCASPDEGNIHLLDVVARPDQREHFLKPLAEGKVRSCFCMTEPGGAGSDPGMLKTTARQDGNEWVINGTKWLITGADNAGWAIIMAKIEGGPMDGHATLFLADLPNPAIKIERTLDTIDSSFTGGHAVMSFNDLRLPADAVLGEIGKGFRYAQVRLAPARLSHCMRWLGSANRAQDIATDYARTREAFGKKLGEHEGVSFMLADNADGHPPGAAVDLAHRLGARPGRARLERKLDEQGDLLRGDRPRRRPLAADPGRPGHHARHGGRAHLPRHPRVPDLRRAVARCIAGRSGRGSSAGRCNSASTHQSASTSDADGSECTKVHKDVLQPTGAGRGRDRWLVHQND